MRKDIRKYRGLSRLPIFNHWHSAAAKIAHYNALPIFEQNAVVSWITSYLKYAFLPRHWFLDASKAPNKTSCYTMPNAARVSVAGDWGTGTEEAAAVADQMIKWEGGAAPDLTFHLGDVYYVGDERETRQNCLDGDGLKHNRVNGVKWPSGALGSFALNGNHEMYAGGWAYFRTFLPALGMKDASGVALGQGPSFFCIENDFWRIIGIDTGYDSIGLPILSFWFEGHCRLRPELINWLRDIVKPRENPKATILMSHHQYYSAFDQSYPLPARQLAEFFDQPVLWLWGHEHRLAGYELFGLDQLKAYGRCMGNGGMPVEIKRSVPGSAAAQHLSFYDARVNPLYKTERLGLNGFAQLRFEARDLTIQYKTLRPWDGQTPGYNPEPELLLTETFRCDGARISRTQFERHCAEKDFVTSESKN